MSKPDRMRVSGKVEGYVRRALARELEGEFNLGWVGIETTDTGYTLMVDLDGPLQAPNWPVGKKTTRVFHDEPFPDEAIDDDEAMERWARDVMTPPLAEIIRERLDEMD